MNAIINNTVANRKALREHAREALATYSPIMTWVLLDSDGDLYILTEAQGQTYYTGKDIVIATTGGFHKSCGEGEARDENGRPYKTQRSYLKDLLGKKDYDRLFNKGKEYPDFIGRQYSDEKDWY